MGHEGDMEENEEKQQWDPLVGTVAGSLGVRWTMGRLGRENQPGPGECPSASLCLQCATYKLCHPEELVLLGHSLGIPQAPLSRCSIQALQLVSLWKARGTRRRMRSPGIRAPGEKEYPIA